MKLQMTPKFPALVVASGNGIALTVANGVYTFTGANSTFAVTDPLTQYNFGYESGEGAARMAQRIFRSAMPGAHGGSAHYCFGIEARPVGSLANGSINADIALGVSNLKHNWQSQSLAQAGEIDGIWISVKQGGPSASASDCGALLFDVATVGDSGYAVGLEGEVAHIDASQTLLRQIGVTICSIDGKTGTMQGFVSAVTLGTALYGFNAAANGGNFTYPFAYVTTAGGLRWTINANGSQSIYPIDGTDTHFVQIRNVKDVSHPIGSFILYDSVGAPFFDVLAIGTINTYGVISSFAGVVNSPAYSFQGSGGSGFYAIGTDHIGLAINAVKLVDYQATGAAFSGSGVNITLNGNATPKLVFAPSSGSTRMGTIYQTANTISFAENSVSDKMRIDLDTGVVLFMTDRGVRFENQTSGAAAQTGTLTNAPAAGNPGHWLKILVGGTSYCLPAWAG